MEQIASSKPYICHPYTPLFVSIYYLNISLLCHMEQLSKIPVSHSWEIPSLKCPIYSSFVSGRLFILRHFILFTVISESISFDGEFIYHSAHTPISHLPHFSHFGILLSSSEHFFFLSFFLSFQAELWSLERHWKPTALEESYLQFLLGLPASPRDYKSWRL